MCIVLVYIVNCSLHRLTIPLRPPQGQTVGYPTLFTQIKHDACLWQIQAFLFGAPFFLYMYHEIFLSGLFESVNGRPTDMEASCTVNERN